jgi:uncharacterized protein YegP (UPF0339 family)
MTDPTKTEEVKLPETVQPSGVEPPVHRPYFEIAKDKDGNWHWVLWSANGHQMAINALPYPRQNDITTAIKAVMRAMPYASKIVVAHPIS